MNHRDQALAYATLVPWAKRGVWPLRVVGSAHSAGWHTGTCGRQLQQVGGWNRMGKLRVWQADAQGAPPMDKKNATLGGAAVRVREGEMMEALWVPRAEATPRRPMAAPAPRTPLSMSRTRAGRGVLPLVVHPGLSWLGTSTSCEVM
jgi:hypothetical protein